MGNSAHALECVQPMHWRSQSLQLEFYGGFGLGAQVRAKAPLWTATCTPSCDKVASCAFGTSWTAHFVDMIIYFNLDLWAC
mmetsp:Transcript_29656/g.50371  ORF Transcript_29656/g.50371 Transcript_29656/m.50371 type:complete len:81 (+) Transcript_29656:734-976(+)